MYFHSLNLCFQHLDLEAAILKILHYKKKSCIHDFVSVKVHQNTSIITKMYLKHHKYSLGKRMVPFIVLYHWTIITNAFIKVHVDAFLMF